MLKGGVRRVCECVRQGVQTHSFVHFCGNTPLNLHSQPPCDLFNSPGFSSAALGDLTLGPVHFFSCFWWRQGVSVLFCFFKSVTFDNILIIFLSNEMQGKITVMTWQHYSSLTWRQNALSLKARGHGTLRWPWVFSIIGFQPFCGPASFKGTAHWKVKVVHQHFLRLWRCKKHTGPSWSS